MAQIRKFTTYLLILAVLAFQQASGLYFYMTDGQVKCFKDELIKYSVRIIDHFDSRIVISSSLADACQFQELHVKVSILDEQPLQMILNNEGAIGISMTLTTPDQDVIEQLIQPDQDLAYNTTASKLQTRANLNIRWRIQIVHPATIRGF